MLVPLATAVPCNGNDVTVTVVAVPPESPKAMRLFDELAATTADTAATVGKAVPMASV